MSLSMIKKDFLRNKAINITLLLFIVLSAALVSLGAIITIQVFDSIETMYEVAQPPHFMQMHTGDVNHKKIDDFAKSISYVKDWQDIEMVNVYGGNIWITKPDGSSFSMSNSLLDFGVVKQNKQYDLLLNMDNKPLYPSRGEIGVPIILVDSYSIDIGDTLTIKDGDFFMNFVVTSFVRDSQMNSTICSSTRFLINEEDHIKLEKNTGDIEHLIEFYFDDLSRQKDFQTAYENAGMPANGQAITYTAIRLISGLSDILMVLVMLLVSFFLIFIVFICLRFTILASMEEDIKSIGTMSAIGMSFRSIRQIYMTKYRILVIMGCSIGYVISIFANRLFIANISRTFGVPTMDFITVIVPISTVLLVYMLEIHFCKRIMKKIKKISVVEALVYGGSRVKNKSSRVVNYMRLHKCNNMPVNLFMGVRDVIIKSKAWFMLLTIVLIVTSITVVPINLLNTFKSKEFINYMGQSMNDIVVSVSAHEGLTEKYDRIATVLNKDSDVIDYTVEARTLYEAINKDGEWTNIHVDSTDVANKELRYIDGNVPMNKNEIAISVMNAKELGVNAGDALTMRINGKTLKINVSGIYQDVTSGGYTAKMVRSYNKEAVKKYSFGINVKNGINIDHKVFEYSEVMGVDVEVMAMEKFVSQTLGGVSRQLSKAVIVVAIMATCLVALFTVLFLKLHVVKDYSQIAIMKAMGFTVLDIRKQYLFKVCLVSLIGIIVGTLFANTLGEGIVSGILSIIGLGISKISFTINIVESYLLCPLAILGVVVLTTWYCSVIFRKYNIIHLINE